MTAQEKIEEAEYFLQKIIDSYENEIEIKYNFSAFLSASRSILEHLLEEYNQRYGVGIGKDDELSLKIFKMRSTDNTNAELFIKNLDNKLELLRKDQPVWSILWKKRNVNIHRDTVKPSFIIKLTTDDPTMPIITYSPAGWMSIKHARDVANTIPVTIPLGFNKNGLKNTKPVTITQSMYWYLNEYAELDLKDICSIFLSLMKGLALKIHQEFP